MQKLKVWFWVATVLMVAEPCYASLVPPGNLYVVLPQTDVVCVGTVTSTSGLGNATFDSGAGYTVHAQASNAEIAVEAVLSGTLPQKRVHIRYPVPPTGPRVSSTTLFYPRIVVGQRAIFLLKRQPTTRDYDADTSTDQATFVLVSPFALPSVVIPIGNASLNGVSSATTPLRKVVLILAHALSVPDDTVRLDCLERIRDSLALMIDTQEDNAGFHTSRQYVRQIRATLAEPEGNKLDDFAAVQILPFVRSLESATSPIVRAKAIITAGSLQDVTVIPLLAKLITGPDTSGSDLAREAADVLASYRTSTALVPMIVLLKDSSLRRIAADALRDIANPIALPFLLEHLDDPDPVVVFNILGALAESMHQEELLPQSDSTPAQKQSQVDYWRKWAATNQNKLNKLRTQFEALPTSSVS